MIEPTANPLLQPWQTPFGLPPFDTDPARALRPGVRARDAGAPRRGRRDRRRAASRRRSTTPSRRSTAAAGTSGASCELFFNLTASETSPASAGRSNARSRRGSPPITARSTCTRSSSRASTSCSSGADELGLTPEQLRLVERDPPGFRARGRPAPRGGKSALRRRSSSASPSSRPASARTFWPTKPATAWSCGTSAIWPACREDLRAAAREAAQERGEADVWMITLSRSLIVPFLTFSDRRDLREQAFEAWTRRGEHDGEHDNRPVAREILALRNEQARLHGYRHYADYALVDRMAGTPEAVARLLEQVWEPAKARAAAERDALRAMALTPAARTHAIEPWDWRYYAEKVRTARYRMDDAALKPYFSLERMLRRRVRHRAAAVRDCASSSARTSAPITPTSRIFEVRGRDGGAGRDLPERQLRAPEQARRRVDERLSLAVARGRRDAADHRQQQQLRQGARRRADAAVGRRRAHAVPRVRARAARPALAGDLRAPVRHAGAARLRRVAVAALRALGLRARGPEAARAASRDRASPSPTS